MTGWLLALDTATPQGSVALLRDGQPVTVLPLAPGREQEQTLFVVLQTALNQNGLGSQSIAAFAASSGPGSFAGVRVGLTAVKALAEALGRPAFGVSTLRAMAAAGSGPRRAPVLDGRRGEVFAGLYDSGLRELEPDQVTRWEAWKEAAGPVEWIGAGSFPDPGVAWVDAGLLAGWVGRLAWEDWEAGMAGDPVVLDAHYVRQGDGAGHWLDERQIR
jgi:tRNA threonylcarbamoyladenosine biosynthesis protein TsaB